MLSEWRSFVPKAADRDDAVKQVWEFYDRYPGRRRKPAAEAFEVVRVTKNGGYRTKKGKVVPLNGWNVWVRRKRRVL